MTEKEKKISPPYGRLSIFTALLSFLIFLINVWDSRLIYHNIAYVMAFFYATFLITYVIHQVAVSRKNYRQEIVITLSVVAIRLIICMFSAYFFLRSDPTHQDVFIVNFLIIYLFYLGFEIYSLLSNLRPHLRS